MDSRKELGRWGEELAVRWLEDNSFDVIERNYRTQWGEIDIVAKKDDVLYFVEVRTVKGSLFSHPLETLTKRKLERLKKTIYCYLKARRYRGFYRTLFIGVAPGDPPTVSTLFDFVEGSW